MVREPGGRLVNAYSPASVSLSFVRSCAGHENPWTDTTARLPSVLRTSVPDCQLRSAVPQVSSQRESQVQLRLCKISFRFAQRPGFVLMDFVHVATLTNRRRKHIPRWSLFRALMKSRQLLTLSGYRSRNDLSPLTKLKSVTACLRSGSNALGS
jgi:hypothetical protein